jgi:hypothetical protein
MLKFQLYQIIKILKNNYISNFLRRLLWITNLKK